MPIIGINTKKENPPYTIEDLEFWMPQYKSFLETDEGKVYFNEIYEVVNNKIFKSIFGADWKYAMGLAFGHYFTLIANQIETPTGPTLDTIAGGNSVNGVITSASIGSFSKSIDSGLTYIQDDEAKWWNLTTYGAELMALLKTKSMASIMVVTSYPVEGGPMYGRRKKK